VRDSKAYNQSDLVQEATMAFVLWPDYLLSQAVINGGSQLGYDGVNFYASTHKFASAGSNAINNTGAATGTTVTAMATDLGSMLTKLKTFKDNAGRLLNPLVKYGSQQLKWHVPAALEQVAKQVVFGSMIPVSVPVTTSGTAAAPVANNVLQGIAEVLADGYLDANSATAHYLHYTGMPQKPFIFLENYPLQVTVLGFNSEFEANNNKIRIALKRRFVLGYYRFDRSVKFS
jgi:phage major head subunit gpT-like protein